MLLGSFANQDQLAELINYGAISGFILLNTCVICMGYKKVKNKMEPTQQKSKPFIFYLKFYVFPALGLGVMLTIFLHMKLITLFFGTVWAIVGILGYFMFNKGAVRKLV